MFLPSYHYFNDLEEDPVPPVPPLLRARQAGGTLRPEEWPDRIRQNQRTELERVLRDLRRGVASREKSLSRLAKRFIKATSTQEKTIVATTIASTIHEKILPEIFAFQSTIQSFGEEGDPVKVDKLQPPTYASMCGRIERYIEDKADPWRGEMEKLVGSVLNSYSEWDSNKVSLLSILNSTAETKTEGLKILVNAMRRKIPQSTRKMLRNCEDYKDSEVPEIVDYLIPDYLIEFGKLADEMTGSEAGPSNAYGGTVQDAETSYAIESY